SKIFNIEREKRSFFSYNHINQLHKKIDWCIRISSAIVIIITQYFIIYQSHSIYVFLVTATLFAVLDYSIRALFEWKYSQNPKQSILTISEMLILITVIAIVIRLDLLNIVSQ
ncbi:DUF4181 domain-containing protein, partial [Bacillus sp. CRN 9]|nr:DUF4181 domain-containing protein [Bacillus sp. CRN 9]